MTKESEKNSNQTEKQSSGSQVEPKTDANSEAKGDQQKPTPAATKPAATSAAKPANSASTGSSGKPPQSPPASATTRKGRSASNGSNGVAWSRWLLIIIILAGLGAIGWYGYQAWLKQEGYISALTTQKNQLAEQQEAAEELALAQRRLAQQVAEQPEQFNTRLERLQGSLSNVNRDLEGQQDGLRSLQSELANLDLSQTTTWRLVEARNLADMAGRKVWLDQDIDSAVTLLELADSHLRALNNPAHLNARQAIRDDIEALGALEQVPVDEIVLQLSSVAKLLEQSDWREAAEAAKTNSTEVTDDVSNWRENLARSWQNLLDQFIRVERRDQPLEPMLAEDFLAVVQQRVQLSLQLAQHAALAGSQERYQQAMAQAENILGQYAPAEQAEINRAQQRLAELQDVSVTAAEPTELTSVPLLQRLVVRATGEANE